MKRNYYIYLQMLILYLLLYHCILFSEDFKCIERNGTVQGDPAVSKVTYSSSY